jgi:hypothetical protein
LSEKVAVAHGLFRHDKGGLSTGNRVNLLGIVSKTINAGPDFALDVTLPKTAMIVGAAGVGVIEPGHELVELMEQFPRIRTLSRCVRLLQSRNA